MSGLFKTLAAALLLGGSAMAIAANDGQIRVNELLNADPQYRETWQGVVKKEERLPEWVMNLSGDADQMNAVEEDGKKYLVGPLCESQTTCLNQRLIVRRSDGMAHPLRGACFQRACGCDASLRPGKSEE